MKIAILLLAMLASGASFAPAQDAGLEREARDAFSHELALCAAFYLVTAEAYRRYEESASARAFTVVANVMLDRAVDMGEEALVMARARRALSEFFQIVGQDMARMPQLVAQYGASCSLCYDHPETVLDGWRKHMAE